MPPDKVRIARCDYGRVLRFFSSRRDETLHGTELLSCIMDIALSEADGNELLKIMKRAKTIPILVLSSKPGQEAKLSAYQAGAHAYMEKPYELEECLAQAEALMDLYVNLKQPEDRSYTLAFGMDLIIDPDRRVVTLSGEELNLTRKEWGLFNIQMA